MPEPRNYVFNQLGNIWKGYKIAQQTADANLKALKAKKERYQNLVELDAVSKQEYDDTVASYESAKATAAAARNNLDYTKVMAPISGYIGKNNIIICL